MLRFVKATAMALACFILCTGFDGCERNIEPAGTTATTTMQATVESTAPTEAMVIDYVRVYKESGT